MKFLHLGDLHLGKSLGDFDLTDDQKYILDEILQIIKDKEADAVLIAGDVYDRAVPSEAATNLLDFFLKSLADLKVTTFVISGNHDSDDRLNYGSSLFRSNGIFINSIYNGQLYKQTMEDEYGEVDVYLLPFVKASGVKRLFPDEEINSYEDAVRVILNHADIDPKRRNILIAHQYVAGKNADPELAGSEGLSVQSVGTVEKIGYSIFDDFDYVALGHIHGPQQVGRETVRYAGSPLKYSLSEVNNAKSVPLVEIKQKGEVETELIPLKPMRDLRHIKGTLKQLLSPENVTDPEDYIYATITDEEIINDAMAIFQQYYPNTVKLEYENSHTKELSSTDITRFQREKSFEEIIREFYEMVYGSGISDEEMALMKEAAKKAGVADETD